MAVRVDLPPPPVAEHRGGGGSGWIVLLNARNDIDARLLSGRLQEAGIETQRVKGSGGPGSWLGAVDTWSPVAVMVRRIQLDEARVVLAEISWEAPAAVPAATPRPPAWLGPAVWWATAIALGLLFTAIGLMQTERYLDGL